MQPDKQCSQASDKTSQSCRQKPHVREVGDLVDGIEPSEAAGDGQQQVAGEPPQGARLRAQQARIPGALREAFVDDLFEGGARQQRSAGSMQHHETKASGQPCCRTFM